MKNDKTLIGLFQGMFEGNILTFNPGWGENANVLNDFDDVRFIQHKLKNSDLKLEKEIENNNDSGPASIVIKDPDGNVILIDQHV